MNKYYLTSAIPYVNAAPHIGHAQEFVYADTVRRFQKLLGKNVLYLCGADENALKIVQAAEKAKLDPQKFCDLHQAEFLDLAKKLNVEFDVWQRGTDKKRHFTSSQKLWELCDKKGDIYKKTYKGLYCVGCEAFYTTDELNENGECFEHPGKKLEEVSEENYFFSLSKYQPFIEDLIEKNKIIIYPDFRKKEALAFVKRGLEDISISRSWERAKGWGVPVPGDPKQIMYVWFDALNIYQSGIGFGWDDENYEKWRPQDLMVIGKGILRFHAIYWPAILHSAGLEVPRELFIHGYLTVDGQKMSKTLGNVVDPVEIIKKYGTDAVRYYLLREIPSYGDGDFSEKRFKELYNADLANGLGNLVARIAKLCENNGVGLDKKSIELHKHIPRSSEQGGYLNLFEQYQFNLILEEVWKDLKSLDNILQKDQPWKLTGEGVVQLIKNYAAKVLEIAWALRPFLPQTAEKILQQYSAEKIVAQTPLFPRIEK